MTSCSLLTTEPVSGRALLSSPIEHGKIVNIAAVNPENIKWEHEKWSVPCDWEELDRLFEGWGPQARGLVEVRLVLHQPLTSQASR